MSSIGHRSCEILMKEKNTLVTSSHHGQTKLCAFRCFILRLQILNLRFRNQICGQLLFSRKLRLFRGSRFSHYFFLLSTLPITRNQERIMIIIILSSYQSCPLPLKFHDTVHVIFLFGQLIKRFPSIRRRHVAC